MSTHPSEHSSIAFHPTLGVYKTYRGYKYQPGAFEYSFIRPGTDDMDFVMVSEAGEQGWTEFKGFVDGELRGARMRLRRGVQSCRST